MKSRLQNLLQIIYESDSETNSHAVMVIKKEQRLLLFRSRLLSLLAITVLEWRCAILTSSRLLVGTDRMIDHLLPQAGFVIVPG